MVPVEVDWYFRRPEVTSRAHAVQSASKVIIPLPWDIRADSKTVCKSMNKTFLRKVVKWASRLTTKIVWVPS
jgi:hypothetical protein